MGRRMSGFLAALFLTAAAGCQDGTGPGTFVVTGGIQNNTQTAIPENAHVVVVWGVSSGTPDYGYVFGRGTINRLLGSFRIEFDAPPPPTALNMGELGVALIVVTTGQSWQDGDSLIARDAGWDDVIGISQQHAVIFVNSGNATQMREWAGAFDIGYSVGVGVHIPNEVFDIFQPVSPSGAVLTIDDPANLTTVNWT